VREQILAETPELLFRMRVVNDKFLKSLREKYNPTDEQVRLMFEQVYPARIFVSVEKHKEKAEARIKEAYAALKAGKPFAEVVQQYSDDPDPIKKQGGRLTGSGYYEIQEQLSNLFGTEVANQVMAFKPNKDFTEPLQDKEKKGYYIYAIAERKMEPPSDFDKNKEGYRQAFINMRISNEQQRVMNAAQQNFKPEFVDPILAQYDALTKTFGTPTPERLKTLKDNQRRADAHRQLSKPECAPRAVASNLGAEPAGADLQRGQGQGGRKDLPRTAYRPRLTASSTRAGKTSTSVCCARKCSSRQDRSKRRWTTSKSPRGWSCALNEFPFLFVIAELYEKAGRKDLAQQTRKRATDMQKEMVRLQKEQEEMIRRQLEELRKQQEAERKKQQETQKQPQSNQQPAANAPQGGQPAGAGCAPAREVRCASRSSGWARSAARRCASSPSRGTRRSATSSSRAGTPAAARTARAASTASPTPTRTTLA
jgi:hypothetical protein